MTDNPIRPDSDPSHDSESRQPDEPVTEEANDNIESTGSTVDATQAEPVSDDVTAAAVDEDATVVSNGVGTATTSETTEPTDADAAETVSTDAAEEPETTDEAPTDVQEPSEEPDEPASDPAETDEVEAAESTDVAATVELRSDEDAAETTVNAGDGDVFVWHPEHKGKSFDDVRAELAQDIAADQRQHRLAMDGAEESEQEALASVVGLERKWGPYDFDWAEQEPEDLADRILAFERERDRRQQMITWADYRDGEGEVGESYAAEERPAELSTSAKGLSLLLVVLLIIVILLAVWAL